jgi:hypothetical protein
MRGKVLLQKVWSKDIDWDDILNKEDLSEWLEIKSDLLEKKNVKINRHVGNSNGKVGAKYMLICFCDASIKTYAITIYPRQESNKSTKVDLIFSKNRLTPLKRMSIPSLELLAVLIGVSCVIFVLAQLKLLLNSMVIMTDSHCVLQWIKSEKKLPTFIKKQSE